MLASVIMLFLASMFALGDRSLVKTVAARANVADIPRCRKRCIANIRGCWDKACMMSGGEVEDEEGGTSVRTMRVLRFLTLFVLFPIIFLMNACSLLISEQRDATSSGMLTAKVILVNAGAMSDYSGAVWVLPRYFPRVWPFDLLVGCRALDFEADPRIELAWEGSTLAIEHDHFAYPVTRMDRCYGRTVTLRERLP